jgi:hypothetical protein
MYTVCRTTINAKENIHVFVEIFLKLRERERGKNGMNFIEIFQNFSIVEAQYMQTVDSPLTPGAMCR